MSEITQKTNHLISIRELSRDDINLIISTADEMNNKLKSFGRDPEQPAEGMVLASLFFEPSTRTHYSFEAAMLRLGGKCWGFSGSNGTSVVKGESLTDTIIMADQYADVLILRHPLEGAARLASRLVEKAHVINAGDGANQHPSQTLLDLYTIDKITNGNISGSKAALVGDLRHARTMRSLIWALALFGAEVVLVAPPELNFRAETLEDVRQSFSFEPERCESLDDPLLKDADVLYLCRIQKERFVDPLDAERVRGAYRIDQSVLENLSPEVAIMHPLPKTSDEVSAEVDQSPHAWYYQQAANGVPVRMAIISLLMEGKIG
jgi:aspartate carbamoyltransferase catalytic subunit